MPTRILPASLLLTGLLCPTIPAAEKEEGFMPIFNGKNLDGWEGEAGFWSVQDGAITGITSPEKPVKAATYLMWRGEKAADFELRFAYRIFSGNSGVQFRSRRLENWDIAGYQADFDLPNQWTGCLYDCNSHRADPNRVIGPVGQKVMIDRDGKRTPSTVADPKELLEHVKKDGWNDYHVIARGPMITLKINGVVMSQVVDHEQGKAAKSGIFAIQLHGGEPMKVQVKDIRLKRLR
jgi:hypothetical protein